jgi:cupin 2 domain-containing protein
MSAENLFSVTPLPSAGGNADEQFDTLLDQPAFRLERIVSTGQATPVGEWLSQPRAEWVVLLTGTAAVRFEDEASPRSLQPGDVLHIPPNRRHRVEWTDAASATVWLALHYDEATRDRAAHDRATQRAEGSRL